MDHCARLPVPHEVGGGPGGGTDCHIGDPDIHGEGPDPQEGGGPGGMPGTGGGP